jgi:hypothetical protein
MSVSLPSGIVCQAGSVHGNANLQYNGGIDHAADPEIVAM